MERGKAYDDHGGVFHKYGTCGLAMGIATPFCRVALLLCLMCDDVHRELQRLITTKPCHRKQNKPTGNPEKGESLQKYAPSLPPSFT